jgi:hypothetical protein
MSIDSIISTAVAHELHTRLGKATYKKLFKIFLVVIDIQ